MKILTFVWNKFKFGAFLCDADSIAHWLRNTWKYNLNLIANLFAIYLFEQFL